MLLEMKRFWQRWNLGKKRKKLYIHSTASEQAYCSAAPAAGWEPLSLSYCDPPPWRGLKELKNRLQPIQQKSVSVMDLPNVKSFQVS